MTRKHAISTEVMRRGAISFYAEKPGTAPAIRVCQGTSCLLARHAATPHTAASAADASLQSCYCLGYCDRSPVALAHDELLVGASQSHAGGVGGERIALGSAALRPSIRCLAREAVVTHGLARGEGAQLASARQAGAYAALAKALEMGAARVLEAIEVSKLCGRGGAGFSTWQKWRSAAQAPGAERYVVANGDEGDPGSFLDRVLLEDAPHRVLEGLVIAAFAIGAQQGIVYIRAEYPLAAARMSAAIREAQQAGILGTSVLGSAFACDVSVHVGRGSYVCGEETALLNSIEGRRGEVRLRPPYPTQAGLFGKPTVVNNIETLVSVPWIVQRGAEAFRALGSAGSTGTKVLGLNRGFARPGLLEVEFGTSLRSVIDEAGGGEELAAVWLGGPMGSVLFPEEWDVPVCYTEMSRRGIELGHGGLIAVPRTVDWRALALHGLEFMVNESCGKCTPCRLGSKASLELLRASTDDATRAPLLRLFEVMEKGSLCAFGRNIPRPLRRLIERHPDRILVSGRP